jgi:hypothetical protein
MKKYADKLRHPNWQKKRLEIMLRDNFKCIICGDKETTLNIHHLKYSNKKPWEIDNKELITVCEHCHIVIEQLKDRFGASFNTKNVNIYKSFDENNKNYLQVIKYENNIYIRHYDIDFRPLGGTMLNKSDIIAISEFIGQLKVN